MQLQVHSIQSETPTISCTNKKHKPYFQLQKPTMQYANSCWCLFLFLNVHFTRSLKSEKLNHKRVGHEMRNFYLFILVNILRSVVVVIEHCLQISDIGKFCKWTFFCIESLLTVSFVLFALNGEYSTIFYKRDQDQGHGECFLWNVFCNTTSRTQCFLETITL